AAYRMGFIDSAQLVRLAEPLRKSSYGQYLLQIAREDRGRGRLSVPSCRECCCSRRGCFATSAGFSSSRITLERSVPPASPLILARIITAGRLPGLFVGFTTSLYTLKESWSGLREVQCSGLCWTSG